MVAALNHWGYNRVTRKETFDAEERALFLTNNPLILYDKDVQSSLYEHAGKIENNFQFFIIIIYFQETKKVHFIMLNGERILDG